MRAPGGKCYRLARGGCSSLTISDGMRGLKAWPVAGKGRGAWGEGREEGKPATSRLGKDGSLALASRAADRYNRARPPGSAKPDARSPRGRHLPINPGRPSP